MKILKVDKILCDDCSNREGIDRICMEIEPHLIRKLDQQGSLMFSDDGLGNGTIMNLVACCPLKALVISDV